METEEVPFERQNVGVVSNLALANLNQDIEDLVPEGPDASASAQQAVDQSKIEKKRYA